ncbi:M13 family metallopeptidase [Brevundimonas sp.]|uniref:M13 family metallopeptidase n=1 Tax=Brevundimonas sp. TaxID=1871086 RepID=UPI0025F8D17A|nr:M13 family metallopeptidase [Brevundimonas sp.]
MLRRLTVLAAPAAVLLILAACQGDNTATRSDPVFGEFGFDTAGMNREAQAGEDWFGYANGGWHQATEIPADRSSYNSFTFLTIQAQERTRAILEEAAADTEADGDLARIGDFYAAFMDEEAIERAGLDPVRPELDAIARISDREELSAALGQTLRADVDLLNATDYYTDRLFGLWVSQDFDAPTRNSPYLVQGGLGMPDRAFYLESDPRMAEMRTAYRAYIARILTLAGVRDAEAKAGRILALETAIARSHATAEQTSDVRAGNNHWTIGEFTTRAPGMDWDAYFQGADLGEQATFVVWQPQAVTGISRLVGSESLETWKDYLTFHALDRASPFLPRAFSEANFAFYGTTLSGTPQQAPRWRRAINATNAALGEAVGRVYVERHFPAEARERADELVRNLMAAFGQRIDALEWMSDETKAAARRKLETLTVSIGYPETWRDYSALEVRRDQAYANVANAELFNYRRNIEKLNRPVSHDEWYMLPQEVNALNVPLENRLIFPAAILEAPFFDANADPAINYGAIGAVIGHEITHSFDSTGALFDETGRLRNWWTPQDFARFEAAGRALAAQYDAYEAFPGLNLNGDLTLGENIADVAGLATAYDAYRLSLSGREAPVIGGFTGDQRFFLGWAQIWRAKYREPALRNAILTNVHAPGPWRAATVRNQDAWYEAFGVEPGQALYLAPEDRVEVW